MRWEDFVQGTPRLGRVAHERLIGPGVLLVVTIRRDGTPRLSPVEPFLLDGDLWLSMIGAPTRRAIFSAMIASSCTVSSQAQTVQEGR